MRLFLTLISVVMIINWAKCIKYSNIEDYSERCSNNRTILIYLTSGMGLGDSSVFMIASSNVLNCEFRFAVKPENYIMTVIEFPDWKSHENICTCSEVHVYMVSSTYKYNICEEPEVKKTAIFYNTAQNNISVFVHSNGELNTIKITATAMRETPALKCDDNDEVKCIFNNKVFCMSAGTLCDGNYNCGAVDKYDEDKQLCKNPELTPRVVMYSIVMGIVSFWLVVSIVLNILPKRKETFVYKFDESTSLFDSKTEQDRIDIDIQIIFPEKKPNESRL